MEILKSKFWQPCNWLFSDEIADERFYYCKESSFMLRLLVLSWDCGLVSKSIFTLIEQPAK